MVNILGIIKTASSSPPSYCLCYAYVTGPLEAKEKAVTTAICLEGNGTDRFILTLAHQRPLNLYSSEAAALCNTVW